MYVQRRELDSTVIWTTQVGTDRREQGNAVVVAADGTVFAAGITSGSFPEYSSSGNTAMLVTIPQ